MYNNNEMYVINCNTNKLYVYSKNRLIRFHLRPFFIQYAHYKSFDFYNGLHVNDSE